MKNSVDELVLAAPRLVEPKPRLVAPRLVLLNPNSAIEHSLEFSNPLKAILYCVSADFNSKNS